MSSLPVFADALSRLHADVAIIRLVRAGIPTSRISAVFPQLRAPNSVCCWLKSFSCIPRASSWPVAAAGLLGKLFRRGLDSTSVGRELESLGLSPETSKRLLEKTEEGRIVVCVHARTESEAAIAWHVFHHVGAESITLPRQLVFTPYEVPEPMPILSSIAA